MLVAAEIAEVRTICSHFGAEVQGKFLHLAAESAEVVKHNLRLFRTSPRKTSDLSQQMTLVAAEIAEVGDEIIDFTATIIKES